MGRVEKKERGPIVDYLFDEMIATLYNISNNGIVSVVLRIDK